MSPDPACRISIAEERRQRERIPDDEIVRKISTGNVRAAVDDLIYFASPIGFANRVKALIHRMGETSNAEQVSLFIITLAISLRSFLPRWNLSSSSRHGYNAMSPDGIEDLANATKQLMMEYERKEPGAVAATLKSARTCAAARYRAEAAADADGLAQALVAGSVGQYIDNIAADIKTSTLRRIAEMRDGGETTTEIGNDYAAFLDYTLYLGATFCTTNPPLIDMAWTAQPDKWNPVVDRLIAAHPGASDDGLAQLVTLEIVLENILLLRPIFLLSDGYMGRVCLQVNPKNHGNAEAMVRDAFFLHEQLSNRLAGGVPNVLFKLPATKAGLETARILTGRGIGVTITVNFGMYQHIPFAQVIAEGSAAYSCLVEMNGRLAFPVRDELLAKLDVLRAIGIDESQAREAAAWSGVAVAKKLHRYLQTRGYDARRIRSLIASLRIYRGDGYESLPNPFLDVTEVLGSGIISVFPNVRRPLDAEQSCSLRPRTIDEPVPAQALRVLSHSEIFRQAYHIPMSLGETAEDELFRPAKELILDNVEDVANWPPNKQTLDQFCAAYDDFVGRIQERR